MIAEQLTIGQVADRTGLAVSAIRYYDDIGLLEPLARVGGKRRFPVSAVGRISFVRRSQEAGFSLDEIASILDDTSGGWRSLVDAKRQELRERRARLDTMIDILSEIGECGCEIVAECPLVGSV